MTTATQENLSQYLKVISEPNRLAILSALKKGPLCVCEIFPLLNLSQNLASHHLKVLKDMGVLESTRDGVKIVYSRNEKTIQGYQSLLTNIV